VSRLDDLSPDQRAVLQLLLRQGKTYDELAALLRIDPSAVRSRAASALAALGPDLDEDDRGRLSDWLLGQQDELQAEDSLDLIDASPAALDWAIAVSDALRDGGLEPRAELPDEVEDEVVDADAQEEPAPAPPPAPVAEDVPVAEARPREEAVAAGLPGFGRTDPPAPRPSRLGGILLIAGVAAIVVVLIVVLLTRGGDDGDTVSAADTGTAAQTSTTPTSTTQGQITVEAQVNMRPTANGGKALGVAQFFTDGKEHGVTVTAQGLKPNTGQDVYALWLAGGTKTKPDSLLGFSPSKVTKNGRFSGSITLPADAGDYREIILTRETQATPSQPGTVVLRGSLSG
jgi:hypothetical protein